MSWISIAILGYFFIALSNLGNKYLLKESIPNPRFFAFSVGLLSGLVFVLLLFGVVQLPSLVIICIALAAGLFKLFGIFTLLEGLKRFELSRVVPAIGGMVPLFTLVGTMFLFSWREPLASKELLAFLFLVGGSVGITLEKRISLTLKSLGYSAGAALLFAGSFLLSKQVYLEQSFLSGLFWISLGLFLGSTLFLFFGDVRAKVWGFIQKHRQSRSFNLTVFLFLLGQGAGAAGGILQNLAIALVPLGHLAFVNALEGTQYVFLFFLALFSSLFFPWIIKEKMSLRIIVQKIVSILGIGVGLVLLAL